MEDRAVQYPHRYRLVDVDTGETLGTYDFTAVPGTVTAAGTEINKASLLSDAVAAAMGLDPDDDPAPNEAFSIINEKLEGLFYGKYSQMSGGSAPSGVDGYLTYSTEDNDDFSAINLAASTSKITIPSGVSKAKFYWMGALRSQSGSTGIYGYIKLYKNGSLVQTLTYTVGVTYADDYKYGRFDSVPVACSEGDYFQIFADLANSSGNVSEVSAGSIFGMEVLG